MASVSSAACNASVRVAIRSHCPSSKWQDAAAPLLSRPNMTLVNVGANKGYAAIGFLMRFLEGWRVDERAWRLAQHIDCGVCLACKQRTAPARRRATHAHVLAVEIIANTSARLREGFRRHGVPGVVVHAAGGSAAGFGYEPRIVGTLQHNGRAVALGGEYVPEHFGLIKAKYGTRVPVVSVDGLHASHGLGVVDLLSIDTEGHVRPPPRATLRALSFSARPLHVDRLEPRASPPAQRPEHRRPPRSNPSSPKLASPTSLAFGSQDAYVLDGASGLFGRSLVRAAEPPRPDAALNRAVRILPWQVRVVEFEYHSRGGWAKRKLEASVAMLGGHGFECFWQGNRGALAPWVAGCDYGAHPAWRQSKGRDPRLGRMSNLVCAREPAVRRVLRRLCLKSAGQ